MRTCFCLILGAILCAPATPQRPVQQPETKRLVLTVDEIMRGPGLYGHEPRNVRWSGDGQRIYFEWNQWSDPAGADRDTYVARRDGSGLRKLTDEEKREAPPVRGDQTRDGKRIAFIEDGDLWLYDRTTDKRLRLTKTVDIESNARFAREETHVAFNRGGNLFVVSLADGSLEQLTDIRPAGSAPDPDEKKGTDSQEQLKNEERSLLDVIGQLAKKKNEEKARREKDNPRKPWRLAARQTITSLGLSPDGRNVIASVMEHAQDAKATIVHEYVTESGYTQDINARTKVGDAQNRTRLALVRVETGEVKWIDHGQKEKDEKGREIERSVTLLNPQWSEQGAKLAVLGRSADNKDRWIFAVDTESAKVRELFHERDEAWLDGPGSFLLGWLGDSATVYFQSEKDGWSHLYSVNFDTGELKQLTSGKWEVRSVELSRDKSKFWLITGENSAHERQLYSMPVQGGARTRITAEAGAYDATLSPDESAMALIHSYTNRPPELYVMDNRSGSGMKRVTNSPAPEFDSYPWLDAPIVTIPSRDGTPVPARLYKPANWKAGGPAVIFVHGAGYLQNVHRWWSSYAREYLFHHLLMERGYIVADVDYRASAGYGRDWRTAIYRHMGGKDLDDQVDAARWLVKEQGVDAKRIGIYGGSYGGFITLMAMFTQPDVFAAGAALRPVTDWAHYNHPYTANILNPPQKDLEAYKQSSPIYHAAGLRGALLICQGMVDTNVHFQDTVRLVQRLIELRKENWELAAYPVENHGFEQPSSWADEYKRILKLFETNLGANPGANLKANTAITSRD